MKQETYTQDSLLEHQYGFSGHEDFPFRYGWPAKGVSNLMVDEGVFSRPDAATVLGVGKNMVKSIRHWMLTMGLARSIGRGMYQVSELGERLCLEDGWDPYLEDPGTLWLLHWQLVRNIQRAGTWHYAFTRWHIDKFTREDLSVTMNGVASAQGNMRATKNTINKDVGTFVRTYVPVQQTRTWTAEDAFSCPLVELGLISRLDRDLFFFDRGEKPTLPPHIFLAALIEYWKDSPGLNETTKTFENLLYGQGSPGAAFKLMENSLWDILAHKSIRKYFRVDDTAGQRNIMANELPDKLDVLAEYYG